MALQKAIEAFGEDWGLVREYLELFRGKLPLKVPKLLRLAREVYQMWLGKFCIGGSWYLIGREEFKEALRATCNQASPGLTNHNYLKKVLLGAARKTSQRREREFKSREQGLGVRGQGGRSGVSPDTLALPELQDLPEDPEWREKLEKLSRAVRKPGLTPEARAKAREALEAHLEEGKRCSHLD